MNQKPSINRQDESLVSLLTRRSLRLDDIIRWNFRANGRVIPRQRMQQRLNRLEQQGVIEKGALDHYRVTGQGGLPHAKR